MSLHLPALSRGRHRGKTGLQLQRELAAAERKIGTLTAANDQLTAERNDLERQLDEASIDYSTALDDLRISRGETTRAQAAVKARESRWANAHRINVPAPRDLRPADERPTIPVDVSSVRAVHRVIPITERPDAANPANIPAA